MRKSFYCSGSGRCGIPLTVQERVRPLNDKPVRPDAEYVVYWSQMNRRVPSNHALAWSIERANELRLPLLVYEGLTCTYPYANDRIHSFMLENVPEFALAVTALGAGYCFYLRRKRADPNDVLYQLAAQAALVVTDDYPTFIPVKHNASVPGRIDVAYHAVDSSCVVPMNRFPKREYAAYTIRPRMHRFLPEYLQPFKMPSLRRKWDRPQLPLHLDVRAADIPSLVATCEIDHAVKPSTIFRGGYRAARKRLDHFVQMKLSRYAEERNEPSAHGTSNLSPYLHFGHISSLEVALAADQPEFREELIVRRELAFNFARHSQFDSLESLPDWARQTLRDHARDARPAAFTQKQIEFAETYDPLWNATQKELLLRGKIHGYYRMYWGKKLIEWASTYEEALHLMIWLHDKYALDGRDPATYTNILWCFGLHDRAWPERPVFGKVRYMSYEGMRRKTNVDAYIREIDHLTRTGQELPAS
jgi:deoxyribodipyrimidine photo-lyase